MVAEIMETAQICLRHEAGSNDSYLHKLKPPVVMHKTTGGILTPFGLVSRLGGAHLSEIL